MCLTKHITYVTCASSAAAIPALTSCSIPAYDQIHHYRHCHNQCSICQKSSGVGVEAPRGGVWPGEGAMPPPQKLFIFFHFKIVYSGELSYTNSKVLFAIECRERYVINRQEYHDDVVIMVFLAIDSDRPTDKNVKFSSIS